MPPPSKRPGRKAIVPEVIPPSRPRSAQPVLVPRSRARTARGPRAGGGGAAMHGPLACADGTARLARAMVVSDEDRRGGDGAVLGGACRRCRHGGGAAVRRASASRSVLHGTPSSQEGGADAWEPAGR